MPLLLDDKFTFKRKIGEGGFCKIYLVTDADHNKFAVKIWKEFKHRMFQDEIKACELKQHPNCVKYIHSRENAPLLDTETGEE